MHQKLFVDFFAEAESAVMEVAAESVVMEVARPVARVADTEAAAALEMLAAPGVVRMRPRPFPEEEKNGQWKHGAAWRTCPTAPQAVTAVQHPALAFRALYRPVERTHMYMSRTPDEVGM